MSSRKESQKERARKLILKRRARFVGVALAGLLPSCNQPQACLSVTAPPPETDPTATAMPCLSPPPANTDAGTETPDAGADDAGTTADRPDAGPPTNLPPHVCLSVRRPPDPKEPKK